MIILNPWTYERIHVCTHYVKKRILIEDREEKKVEISKSFWDLFHALVRFRSIKLKQSVRYVRRPIEFLLCGSVPEKLICLYRTCDKLYMANEQITIKEWNSFINPCPNIFAREEREKKWNPLVPAPFFALSWRQLSDYLFLYYLNCFYPCLTFSWHVFFLLKQWRLEVADEKKIGHSDLPLQNFERFSSSIRRTSSDFGYSPWGN